MSFSQHFNDQEEKENWGSSLPTNIPEIIDPQLLHEGNLLTQEDRIKFQNLKPGYYKRKKKNYSGIERIDSPYNITVISPDCSYVRYPQTLGFGYSARVKVEQNLVSNVFDVSKTLKPINEEYNEEFYIKAKEEFKILRALGRARSGIIVKKSKLWDLPTYQLFMEMAEGAELHSLIQKDKLPHNLFQLLLISLNITNAVQDLIESGYYHCDLSQRNIFVNIHTAKATLIDFGNTISAEPQSSFKESFEVYKLGEVLHELLFEEWLDKKNNECIKRIEIIESNGEEKYLAKYKTGDSYEIDSEIKKFILSLRDKNRPTLKIVSDTLTKFVEAEKLAHAGNFKINPSILNFGPGLVSHSLFKPKAEAHSLIDLLNQGVPITYYDCKNPDGSLKQFLIMDENFNELVKKLRAESDLREGMDFIIVSKNKLEIGGLIKMKGAMVVIEKNPNVLTLQTSCPS